MPLRDVLAAPARYKAETPWGAWSATLATAVIVIAPMAVLAVVLLTLSATGTITPGSDAAMSRAMKLSMPTGVAVLLGSQLISLALVWWFAGFGGKRPEVLRFDVPAPSYRTCIVIGAIFIVLMGLAEFGLYQIFKFDVFKDSKFLVEGLRSPLWPFTLFMAVVLAPLWEELTFRGFLLSALAKTRLGIGGGGLISNALWAILHSSYSVPALVSVFAAGLVITWLVWKTGSLRIAIVTHAMVNLTAAVFTTAFAPA